MNITHTQVQEAMSQRLDMGELWPITLPAKPGFGGKWDKPLGEILEAMRMRQSGFVAQCLKPNCGCDLEHP